MILVRNPNAEHDGCRILYRDIGDYLKREEKLTERDVKRARLQVLRAGARLHA